MNSDETLSESASLENVQFDWAGRSIVGKVREVNEDCFRCLPGLFVVADGMGGHAAGDVASAMVVDHLTDGLSELPAELDVVEQAVIGVNASVRDHAKSLGQIGMGTTLVAAVWVIHSRFDHLALVNVGDSRCYVVDDLGFRRVTRDHSVVQDLVDRGAITSVEARTHPERNVITRAIGVEKDVVADYVLLRAVGRQRLLLCSDGVSAQLSDAEIADALVAAEAPRDAVDHLIEIVMEGSAQDNATAVVVDVEWAAERPNVSEDLEITSPRDHVTGEPLDVSDADDESPAGGQKRKLITSVPNSPVQQELESVLVSRRDT